MKLKDVLRARSSADLEQAVLRVFIGTAVTVYIASAGGANPVLLKSLAGWLVLAFGILAATWVWPARKLPPRMLGMVADVGMLTAALFFTGKGGAGFVWVYLFVIVGNGFRYGQVYFYAAQLLSLAGFALVLFNVPSWQSQPTVAFGWTVGMVVLPIYVAMLVGRLRTARTAHQIGAA